jgi:hypothetical protein
MQHPLHAAPHFFALCLQPTMNSPMTPYEESLLMNMMQQMMAEMARFNAKLNAQINAQLASTNAGLTELENTNQE